MYARVMLLLLTTTLFAVVWHADGARPPSERVTGGWQAATPAAGTSSQQRRFQSVSLQRDGAEATSRELPLSWECFPANTPTDEQMAQSMGDEQYIQFGCRELPPRIDTGTDTLAGGQPSNVPQRLERESIDWSSVLPARIRVDWQMGVWCWEEGWNFLVRRADPLRRRTRRWSAMFVKQMWVYRPTSEQATKMSADPRSEGPL
jgi:hypothetical protein